MTLYKEEQDEEFNKIWLDIEAKDDKKRILNNKLVQEHDRLKGRTGSGWIDANKKTFYRSFVNNDDPKKFCLQNQVPNREGGFTVSCDNRNVKDGVLSEKISKIFTYFPESELDTIMYATTMCFTDKEGGDKRTFYEVMEKHHKRKPYLDIDMEGNLELKHKVIITILAAVRAEMLTKVEYYEHEQHTLVFQSHTSTKASFHVIINDYCCDDNEQVKSFFYAVRRRIPEEYRCYMDHRVYHDNANFRMFLSHKIGKTNMKELTTDYETCFIRKQIDIWKASLITNTKGCTVLAAYPVTEYINTNEDFKAYDQDQIKLHWNTFPDRGSFKFREGSSYLTRRCKSQCSLHPVDDDGNYHEHENNNAYLIIRGGFLYFKCFAGPGEIKLGKVDKMKTTKIEKEHRPWVDLSKLTPYVEKKGLTDEEKESEQLKTEWLNLTYDEMKEKFEKMWFKCVSRGTYYNIGVDDFTVKSRTEMMDSYCHYKCLYASGKFDNKTGKEIMKKSAFIFVWLKDENIRSYQYVKLLPPPLKCPANTYNLFNGWRIEKIKVTEPAKEEDVQFIFDHLAMVWGKQVLEYVLDWLAYYIKYPGLNPKKSLLIKSLEGLGKGAMIDLLVLICGSQYILLCEQVDVYVFGPFNQLLEGILFLGLDEMELSIAKKYAGRLKNMITNNEIQINPKGSKPYRVPNRLHIVSFSNNEWPWCISESNRRYLPVDSSHVPIPNEEYFNKLYNLYDNDAVIKAVFNRFNERDISKFKPANMPNTEFSDDLKALNRALELNFIVEFIRDLQPGTHNVSSKDLFGYYLNYVTENCKNINVVTTTIKFGLKIKSFNIDGFKHIVGRKGNSYDINAELALKWCQYKKYITPDPI